ncbi:uncharacterized protein [Nicotiana tomentosiformis]|uniref:uncharacterized protein n=1 Tax=Nicotiana tomentosiformis TaxID=4098 RepID=UPI00388C99E0
MEVEPKTIKEALKDPDWIITMQDELNQFERSKMDVKSAYLNGYLKEEVFVKQPPGFESEEFPDYVFKLDKALYSLKQAPKAYERLSKFLLANNFVRGKVDNTLFLRSKGKNILIVQVYVDDIILGVTPRKISKYLSARPVRSPVEKFTVEERTGDLGKEVDTTVVEPVVEEEGHKNPVQKEASDFLDFSWTENEENDEGEKEEEVMTRHEEHDAQNIDNEEEKSENEGVSGNEKESDTKDKTSEQAHNYAEEENQSEEEEVFESEGED